MKTIFINPERCIGCKQCQIACAVEHSKSKNIYKAINEHITPRPRILVAPGLYINSSLPNQCRHCDPAPCMGVCPTGAISRDSDLGMVLVDGKKCITCAMCAMVCPFDVLTFNPQPDSESGKPVATKCDHCIDRRRKGEVPACVEACKVDALVFGELNDLIKSARTSLSKKVSMAAGEIEPEILGAPKHMESWRGWGKKVDKLNKR